jgi:hypothetical protein
MGFHGGHRWFAPLLALRLGIPGLMPVTLLTIMDYVVSTPGMGIALLLGVGHLADCRVSLPVQPVAGQTLQTFHIEVN